MIECQFRINLRGLRESQGKKTNKYFSAGDPLQKLQLEKAA